MGKYQKNIEAARRITVMQYLETYHPGELVRKTDCEYCTRTHDSLIITPANGFFHWFSRHVGGNKLSDQGGGHTAKPPLRCWAFMYRRMRILPHSWFILRPMAAH